MEKLLKKKEMEEKKLLECGLRELNSSELQMCGGTANTLGKIFEKIRNLIDTIMDYLPSFFSGFKDGLIGSDSSK